MSNPSFTRIALAAIIGLVFVATPRQAAAVQHPDSCDFTCTTDCELNTDIICNNTVGIALTNGADLDLKGHKIICDNPFDIEGICTGTAASMTANNSVIRDTGVPRGGIEGPFAKAIDCQARGGSRVTGITVNGVDGSATINCAQVDGNVIISRTQLDYVGNAAILLNSPVAATIRNNYVANFGVGISASGNKIVTIDGNLIEAQEPLGGTGFTLSNPVAIAFGFNSNAGSTVTNNQLVGPGGQLIGNAVATFANNRCDVTSADCLACLTAGYCSGPAVPYFLDRSFVMRPRANGESTQFSLFIPVGVPGYLRWVLVDDDDQGVLDFSSYVTNSQANIPRTDLYYVGGTGAIDADIEFQSCVLEAHMSVPMGFTVPTYLVVKLNGVQSDGPAINVSSGYPAFYQRSMPTNPTNGRWTGADLTAESLQIGVKNNAGTSGLSYGDIVMRCK